ncbi:histidinol dehydrogenase [Methanobacterium formicicum]|uniref:Histidinol dehydrogenase n=1 Tax=Methanobacterium formicicum (strain DSM 3637 / PP1) TaxID=1204725 RepID=K2RQD1_METFP|nr:histidinol dehydrogenase [Methanobacterium formicicum]EKF84950.1 bifunctional histidinal dehydrogenase/ histidinol dehydrogenase [Methanobacterium formicicum DSM 3637]
MKTVKINDENIGQLLGRSQIDSDSVMNIVNNILSDVKNNGDESLRQYTEKFDGVDLKDFLIKEEELKESLSKIEDDLVGSLKQAASNIRKFHQAQLPQDWSMEVDEGITAGQIVRPLERVGCYIPGGRAVYPSSILMTVIPAKVAGVDEIICCTPPGPDGKVEDIVLAAAYLAGADKVYRVGGAQAIAALAYGTQTIPAVDKIVGPGNVFVTAAKKMVYGQVDIDFPAGPSEVLIIADETGNPDYITLDLLAQAEHDPQAASVLVTTSPELARSVETKIKEKLPQMKRDQIITESLQENGKIILAGSLDEAVNFSNAYAPEHLMIMTRDPEEVVKYIKNAGSIFLGNLTPVAAGDYGSGTNHVLPTSFCARMYSGLSTESFLKKPTVQRLSREGLENLKDVVIPLAEYEGLYAHAESFKKRLDDE